MCELNIATKDVLQIYVPTPMIGTVLSSQMVGKPNQLKQKIINSYYWTINWLTRTMSFIADSGIYLIHI